MADSVIYYKDLIGEDSTFDDIFENIEELKKELEDLTKVMRQELSVLNPNEEKRLESVTNQIDKLIKAKTELNKQDDKAKKTKKKLNELEDKEIIAREKLKIANRERVQILKQTAILQAKESGEIEKLRAKLALTTIQWKKLSKEELKNGRKGKQLISTKRKLTNELKRLEKQTGDTRRNVGNYTSALGKMGKVASRLFVGRTIVDGIRRIGGAFVDLFQEAKEGNEVFQKFDRTVSGLTSSVKGVGVSFLSAVVPVLQEGVRLFQFFGEKIQSVAGGGSVLGKVFDFALIPIRKLLSFFREIPFVFTGIVASGKQLGINIGNNFRKLGKQLEIVFLNIDKINPFSDKSKDEIARNIENLKSQIDGINDSQVGVGQAFKDAYNGAKKEFEDFKKQKDEDDKKQADAEKRKEGASKRRSDAIKEQNKLIQIQINLQNNLNQRIKAIESLQSQLDKTETQNIKDKQERMLRLEQLRFETETEARQKSIEAIEKLHIAGEKKILENYETSSQEYKDFIIKRDAEIVKITSINDELETEQLKVHEQNKLNIKLDFAEQYKKEFEKIRKEEIAETEKEIEEQDEKEFKEFEHSLKKKLGFLTKAEKEQRNFERQLFDLKIQNIKSDAEREIAIQKEKFKRMREDIKANEKLTIAQKKQLLKEVEQLEKKSQEEINKKRSDELLDGIIESSKKIGQAIVDVFEKQSDLAASLVEEQADAVETQQQRAENGLTNTLKFEKDELAKREGEKIRAEQKAKNSAKILALFNLVSAYAQSGDSNALQRGLVDFALLTALESAFTGFEDGGFTGSDSSNSKVKGVVHANEYVVTQSDVDKFGLRDKSGSEFGSAMSDYFNEQSPLLLNTYDQQNTQFSNGIKHTNQVDFSRLEHEVRAMRQAFQNQQKNDFDIEHMTDYFVDIAKRVTQNRMTTVTKVRKRL